MLYGLLAVRLAENHWSGSPEDDCALEGDAWKECASALLKMGHYKDALEACDQARSFYSRVDSKAFERAVLGLIEGQVLYFTNQAGEGLSRISQSADLLLTVHQNRKKYVEARIIYASIFLRLEKWREALDVLEETRDIAKQEGDAETLAHILNNIAYCYTSLETQDHQEYLRNQRKAYECFGAARTMFADLELWAEVPRTQVGITIVLRNEGKYNEAISELFKTRDIFLRKLRHPLDAARVSVRIVECALLAKRTDKAIQTLCADAFTTLQEARLDQEALKALAYLNELAQEQRVQMDDVEHVLGFLERLDGSNSLTFEAQTS